MSAPNNNDKPNNSQCHTAACKHNNDPSFRLDRVAECTISGLDVRTREFREFSNALKFYPDEQLLYLYWDKNEFEKYYHANQGIFVGLTNYRIFKLEGSAQDFVELRMVASVNHQKNGMFRWDKVELRLIDGRTETFGIYQGSTTEYFCNAVRTAIAQLPKTIPVYTQQQQPQQFQPQQYQPGAPTGGVPNY